MQPLGFLSVFAGALLLIAGVTGSSVASVAQGAPDHAKASGPSAPSSPSSSGELAGTIAGSVPNVHGLGRFDGKPVAAWIVPILTYARAHGWRGTVTSGYRSLAEQTRIYNSGVRPAAVPGTSNHEQSEYPGGAVDVTEAAQLSAILARSPFAAALVWAGAKDPVHFSHPHGGSY